MEATNLAVFWAGVIALSILVYVILDGFDLGVGILFGCTRDTTNRQQMLNTIAPFWDGNETWLVIIGASLFAAFPAVYAVFLGAFYIPVLLMLFGLIFRGIAFEFRQRSRTHGLAMGPGVLHRIHRRCIRPGRGDRRHDAGNPRRQRPLRGPHLRLAASVSRSSPVLAWCLATRCSAPAGSYTRAKERFGIGPTRGFPWLVVAVFVVLALAFTVALTVDAGAIAQGNWRARGWGMRFPMLGVAALVGVVPAPGRAAITAVPFTVLFFLRLT